MSRLWTSFHSYPLHPRRRQHPLNKQNQRKGQQEIVPCSRGVLSCEATVQCGPKTIEVRAWRGLGVAQFRSCIADRPESSCILGLSRRKKASNPEVDQIDMSLRRHHNIRRLEITKNNRLGLPMMQVIQHITKLDGILYHLLYIERMPALFIQ